MLTCGADYLAFTGNKPNRCWSSASSLYSVCVEHLSYVTIAARFSIFMFDMLAKLKGDTEILTNIKISLISK